MGELNSVAVLGSTGSIGTHTLDVIARCPDRFSVRSLAANRDVETIAAQMHRFGVRRAAMVEPDAAAALRERVPGSEVLQGEEALVELASDPEADVVLNAIVGAAGLRATLAGLDAGRTVALANKESCVAGGPLVRRRLQAGATLVPVDSEHAAVHMCLEGEDPHGVREIVLTASGGPFRGRTDLSGITPKDALAHPTWQMGPKITIDSATLMNKGLEVIEAHILFATSYEQIQVVVHPQSVVHCLVGFADGSWKASLSPPDMRIPIAYAIGGGVRPGWGAERTDWTRMRDLTFEPVDQGTFRCLALAYTAGRTGGTAPAVLNAANEVAVAAFLDGRIPFTGIADAVDRALQEASDAGIGMGDQDVELPDILRADAWARTRTSAGLS